MIAPRRATCHRVPRSRPRAGRARAADQGPGAQDLDHPAWSRARLHAGAPDRGSVPPLAPRVARRDGDVARRPYRGGVQVRRSDDRGARRHRPRHRDRAAHGHRVRDERHARARPLRSRERGSLRRPRHGSRTRVLAGGRGHDRCRGSAPDRRRALRGPHDPRDVSAVLDRLAGALLERETLDAADVEELLAAVPKWHEELPAPARASAVASSEPPASGRPLV